MMPVRTLLLIELLVDRTNAEPVLPTNIFNSKVGTNVVYGLWAVPHHTGDLKLVLVHISGFWCDTCGGQGACPASPQLPQGAAIAAVLSSPSARDMKITNL